VWTSTAAIVEVNAVLLNFALGCVLMIVTTIVHAAGMGIGLQMLRVTHAERWASKSRATRLATISCLVLIMFLASMVEAGIWAGTYMAVGAISGLEPALYFSTVTYTTLGYGDLVLHDQWRLLGSIEAANGIIMFGWTTALIFAAVQRVYFAKLPAD
jgi:hypothetical protein